MGKIIAGIMIGLWFGLMALCVCLCTDAFARDLGLVEAAMGIGSTALSRGAVFEMAGI